jgi:hypothetical protein
MELGLIEDTDSDHHIKELQLNSYLCKEKKFLSKH